MAKRNPKASATNETLDQTVQAVISGLDDIAKALRNEMRAGFNELKAGQSNMKRQLNDLKDDTPTRKEFDGLKAKVDRYQPL